MGIPGMRTILGYLIAMVLVILSQFGDERAWLGIALLCVALVVALLATTRLGRDVGLLGRLVKLLSNLRSAPVDRPLTDRTGGTPAPHAKVPRPAGPVGPMPVLQKQPKRVTGGAM